MVLSVLRPRQFLLAISEKEQSMRLKDSLPIIMASMALAAAAVTSRAQNIITPRPAAQAIASRNVDPLRSTPLTYVAREDVSPDGTMVVKVSANLLVLNSPMAAYASTSGNPFDPSNVPLTSQKTIPSGTILYNLTLYNQNLKNAPDVGIDNPGYVYFTPLAAETGYPAYAAGIQYPAPSGFWIYSMQGMGTSNDGNNFESGWVGTAGVCDNNTQIGPFDASGTVVFHTVSTAMNNVVCNEVYTLSMASIAATFGQLSYTIKPTAADDTASIILRSGASDSEVNESLKSSGSPIRVYTPQLMQLQR
jgi:hypothetical protein